MTRALIAAILSIAAGALAGLSAFALGLLVLSAAGLLS